MEPSPYRSIRTQIAVWTLVIGCLFLLGGVGYVAYVQFIFDITGGSAGRWTGSEREIELRNNHLIGGGFILVGLVLLGISIWGWAKFFSGKKTVDDAKPMQLMRCAPTECWKCNMVISSITVDHRCPHCKVVQPESGIRFLPK